jgi:hypothetical protein
MFRTTITALVLAATFPTVALSLAIPLPPLPLPPPGAVIPLPLDGEWYQGTYPLDGANPGEIVLDVILQVPAGGGTLSVVQAFGGCVPGDPPYGARFSLYFDGAFTPWSEGIDPFCDYHNHY